MQNESIDQFVARVTAYTEKATPGPWSAVRSVTCGHLRASHNFSQYPTIEWHDDDIAFIDESRADLPAALGHIAALQALCKRAAGELMLVNNHAAFNEISDELVRDLANGGNGCQ